MRQFVFGILAAALVLWGYRQWQGTAALGASPEQDSASSAGEATAVPEGRLGDMLAPPAAGDLAARQAPAPADGVDREIEAFENREPGSIDGVFAALASDVAGPSRAALVRLVTPAADDFESRFAALGSFNTFLFSAEGRELASRAAAAALALPDAQACAAGSRLLGLFVRGRIDKQDVAQRAFVDQFYAQHRIRVDRWLCDPTNVARARSTTIESSLTAVASKFRREGVFVDATSLAVLNRIANPNVVRAGQKIKVPLDPIRAVLEKRSFALMVFVGDHLLRLYWVGHGENDHTPVAEFTVVEKQHQPAWTAPNGRVYPYGHPENILGEWFLKFQHPSHQGFGAHGTPQPETVCTMSSAGCIRMLAADIEDLARVLPRGAKVEIRASEAPRQ